MPTPDLPTAELSLPPAEGRGTNLIFVGPHADAAAHGYTTTELFASGTASSLRPAGDLSRDDLPTDGRWELAPGEPADFCTRVVVRQPTDPGRHSGTVLVEWLNVSGGLDAPPLWGYLGREIVRAGHTWVGVSAQHLGVEGGAAVVATVDLPGPSGIRATDPERYGTLTHPGDAFAYDIYTQVARALWSPRGVDALDGRRPARILAIGESQSAFALTSYINGAQPLAGAFDGFFVHSRGGSALPLAADGGAAAAADAIAGPAFRIRTDGRAPVLVVETESDLFAPLHFLPARQDDDDRFRLWEIAGSAHVDGYLLGPLGPLLGCGDINDGGQQFALWAGLRHLDRWAAGGEAPPTAPRLEVAADGTAIARDGVGIAGGGLRLPMVDVPVAALSGTPNSDSLLCQLMGSTVPFDEAELRRRYPTVAAYEEAFAAAADAAVAAGYVLGEDKVELLAAARPDAIGS